MPRLPQVSGKERVKAFLKDGWPVIGQKGSHVKPRRVLEGQEKTIIIPQHKTVKKGTLAGILKDSGISLDRLREIL